MFWELINTVCMHAHMHACVCACEGSCRPLQRRSSQKLTHTHTHAPSPISRRSINRTVIKNKNMEDAGTYHHIKADKQKFLLGFTICFQALCVISPIHDLMMLQVCVYTGLVYASITHCIYANAVMTVSKNLWSVCLCGSISILNLMGKEHSVEIVNTTEEIGQLYMQCKLWVDVQPLDWDPSYCARWRESTVILMFAGKKKKTLFIRQYYKNKKSKHKCLLMFNRSVLIRLAWLISHMIICLNSLFSHRQLL